MATATLAPSLPPSDPPPSTASSTGTTDAQPAAAGATVGSLPLPHSARAPESAPSGCPSLDPSRPSELDLESLPLPRDCKYHDQRGRSTNNETLRAMHAFLRGLRANGTITNGLLRAQIDRRTYNRWLHKYIGFADDCDLVRLEHREFLEDRLMYDIKKGDSIALRLKLRGEFPEKYGNPLLRRAAALPAAEALGPDPTAVEEIDIWADRQVHPPVVQ